MIRQRTRMHFSLLSAQEHSETEEIMPIILLKALNNNFYDQTKVKEKPLYVCVSLCAGRNKSCIYSPFCHVMNKHQSDSVIEKSYVTCCEIYHFVFLYNLALLWFGCT